MNELTGRFVPVNPLCGLPSFGESTLSNFHQTGGGWKLHLSSRPVFYSLPSPVQPFQPVIKRGGYAVVLEGQSVMAP